MVYAVCVVFIEKEIIMIKNIVVTIIVIATAIVVANFIISQLEEGYTPSYPTKLDK